MQAITDFLSRKIVIVTLFYYRSVPQLKYHNFLPDHIYDGSISIRSSYKGRKGNALASGADEGRDKLR